MTLIDVGAKFIGCDGECRMATFDNEDRQWKHTPRACAVRT